MTLAVDVGGTFTDLALWDVHGLRVEKVLTTAQQNEGVVSGSQVLLKGAEAARLLHGTTVATNAVLERKGARVVLVTSQGIEDVIEIGRQDRPALYDVMADRPEPLVPREHRFGVSSGDLSPEHLALEVAGSRPEAVAVSLLYGFSHPEDEEAIARALEKTIEGVPVSLSGRVAPEFREYERTSTTVLNAYLTPVMSHYLERLASRVLSERLARQVLVMRSSGGLMDVSAAVELPAAALLSGPAGGAVAAAAVGESHGLSRTISFDMGGTSTDVCRIEDSRPRLMYERDVGGHPCRLPSVAIHTVGAGGGSVGWLDAGGALRVGPSSAGADPGPASYGAGGTRPTVTDAHVALGRIGRTARLAGEVAVRPELARQALETIGEPASLTLTEAAAGVVEVADARMERAIRRVSMEEGADPRGAWLVAFGGAGGLHATSLARRFEMEGVIVPPHAGVLSAIGLLLSPMRADRARSLEDPRPAIDTIKTTAASLEKEVWGHMVKMGSAVEGAALVAEVRYAGQSHETAIPLYDSDELGDLAERFHAEHHRRNGFSRPGDPIEVVTVRAEATSAPTARWGEMAWIPESGDPRRGTRTVFDPNGSEQKAEVHWRPRLQPKAQLLGPAVIEEPEATTFLAAGDRAAVLEDGSLEVTW